MSTKKAAQLHHSEIRQIFTAFDMQCKSFFPAEFLKRDFHTEANMQNRALIQSKMYLGSILDGSFPALSFYDSMFPSKVTNVMALQVDD